DVRENVRYPTGGHFPEWVYATWGDRVCTISPEYKKIHMDEWTGQVDIDALEDFRDGLESAVDGVRGDFLPRMPSMPRGGCHPWPRRWTRRSWSWTRRSTGCWR